jgi:hypothetical protein
MTAESLCEKKVEYHGIASMSDNATQMNDK